MQRRRYEYVVYAMDNGAERREALRFANVNEQKGFAMSPEGAWGFWRFHRNKWQIKRGAQYAAERRKRIGAIRERYLEYLDGWREELDRFPLERIVVGECVGVCEEDCEVLAQWMRKKYADALEKFSGRSLGV